MAVAQDPGATLSRPARPASRREVPHLRCRGEVGPAVAAGGQRARLLARGAATEAVPALARQVAGAVPAGCCAGLAEHCQLIGRKAVPAVA